MVQNIIVVTYKDFFNYVYDILKKHGYDDKSIDDFIVILYLKNVFIFLQKYENYAFVRDREKKYDMEKQLYNEIYKKFPENFSFESILSLSIPQINKLNSELSNTDCYDWYIKNLLPIIRDYKIDCIIC